MGEAFACRLKNAGKTGIFGEVVAGRPMARMAPATKEDEERKRITAIAVAGDPLVLIDNVTGLLGTAALDAALLLGACMSVARAGASRW